MRLTKKPIATRDEAERWLMAFCTRYAPERKNEVAIILKRFEGQETQLREAMESVFGVVQPVQGLTASQVAEKERQEKEESEHEAKSRPFRERLRRFFNLHDKRKIEEIPKFARTFLNCQDQLFQNLIKKYGPEPAFGEQLIEYKNRIRRIYKKYNPSFVFDVDALLERHAGNEEHLISMLVSKYGPEPNSTDIALLSNSSPSPSHSPRRDKNSNDDASPSPTSIPPEDLDAITNEYRRRLIRFFEHYEPVQLKTNLEKLLRMYKGKETEMMNGLVACYGPEPKATSSSTTASSPASSPAVVARRSRSKSSVKRFVDQVATRLDREDEVSYQKRIAGFAGINNNNNNSNHDDQDGNSHAKGDAEEEEDDEQEDSLTMSHHTRKRLLNYFAFYDPPRVRDISHICAVFAGREDEMWKVLRRRFGAEPPGENKLSKAAIETSKRILRGIVDRFYSHYDPSRMYEVDHIASQYLGREDECKRMLERRFGPEPKHNILAEDIRKRLILFFRIYDPPQLENVDVVANAYIGMETELFQLLTTQYGPEPDYASPRAIDEFKTRLVRFFKQYPDAYDHYKKSSSSDSDGITFTVDQLVVKYEDWEHEFISELVEKYGPEPDDPELAREEQRKKQEEEHVRALLRERLELFFNEYDKDQLANVDTLIDSYWTQPDELLNLLCDAYGVERSDNTPGYAASTAPSSAKASPLLGPSYCR